MRSLVFTLFLLAVSFDTMAADIIRGNTRTQTRTIQKIVSDCDRDLETNLRQCILNSKLFADVRVILVPEGRIIEVDDRWSLIPIPFAQARSDGPSSVGFFLMDGNFAGLGSMLGAGGSFSSSKQSASLFYRDRSFFFTDWTMGASLNRTDADIRWHPRHRDTLMAFRESTSSANLSFGRPITSRFSWNAQLGARHITYHALDGFQAPSSTTGVFTGYELLWAREDYKFYFSDGLRIRQLSRVELERAGGGDHVIATYLNLAYGKEIVARQALQLSFVATAMTGGDERDAIKAGRDREFGGRGFRGIPEGAYFTHALAGLGTDYQIPLAFTSKGTWTLAPFIDLGAIRGHSLDSRNLIQEAHGIGSYFYLTRVMLPGLGLILGQNTTFDDIFAEFSIGGAF